MTEVPIHRTLTLEEIQEAYQEYQELLKSNTSKTSFEVLTKKYPVSSRTLRRYFKDVDSKGQVQIQETVKRPPTRYNEEIIKQAFKEYQDGSSLTQLSRKYGIPSSTLSRQLVKMNGGKKLRGAKR